jgi:hypothetical protein
MPAVIPFIPLIAAGVSGAVSLIGQHKAANAQQKAQNQAIDYATQQENERRREWDVSEAARKHADEVAMQMWQADQSKAKFMWDEQQRQLAPYRAARQAVMGRYGIAAAPAAREMPAGYGGVGPAPTPGQAYGGSASAPMMVSPHVSGGSGAGLGALAAGIGGAGSIYAQYMAKQGQQIPLYGSKAYSNPVPGSPGGPPGPPTQATQAAQGFDSAAFAPVFQPNLDAYTGYGIPDQTYQGE